MSQKLVYLHLNLFFRSFSERPSLNTSNEMLSTLGGRGYSSPEEHYHTIDPVYDTTHDGYNEPMRNPYLVLLELDEGAMQ